jgi:(4-(4-[2-(gamma-L-glutamylamino)ethyl]phenoxymethyl)furan-2-yl)methanamine synthase
VMAEYFATVADVYRLTGELEEAADMAETADGKGKSLQESARRLARMVGHDVEDKSMPVWIQLAFSCRTVQLTQLKNAVLKHIKPNMALIGAGAGSFLVKALADELKAPYLSINAILASKMPTKSECPQALEVCFPAYAVAQLCIKANQA